jgi:carbonic anhydrase/acetyltransferase-like protein (isoleucine patch superfamily)
VRIGHSTNLQDGVHVGSLNPASKPTSIGSFVSVGHGAVLQGCTVQDKVLVGMNAVLQDGVTVSGGRAQHSAQLSTAQHSSAQLSTAQHSSAQQSWTCDRPAALASGIGSCGAADTMKRVLSLIWRVCCAAAGLLEQVESGSIIAAGAVVEAGSTVPSGEVWAGSPARRLRAVKQVEAEYLDNLPARCVRGLGRLLHRSSCPQAAMGACWVACCRLNCPVPVVAPSLSPTGMWSWRVSTRRSCSTCSTRWRCLQARAARTDCVVRADAAASRSVVGSIAGSLSSVCAAIGWRVEQPK